VRFLSVIWPTTKNTTRTALTVLGRVLHWIAVGAALLSLASAVWMFVLSREERGNDYWKTQPLDFDLGVAFAVIALLVYTAGRIARRLLSRE
jgi:cytochrome b561